MKLAWARWDRKATVIVVQLDFPQEKEAQVGVIIIGVEQGKANFFTTVSNAMLNLTPESFWGEELDDE